MPLCVQAPDRGDRDARDLPQLTKEVLPPRAALVDRDVRVRVSRLRLFWTVTLAGALSELLRRLV